MECPVCGRKSDAMLCPECGFDTSRDYENYPTLGPVEKAPSVSALRKKWQKTQQTEEPPKKKKNWLSLMACALILMLGIGIGAGFGGENNVPDEHAQMQTQPGKEEPWRENILRSDELPRNEYGGIDLRSATVFTSEYRREQIGSITFVDTLTGAPEDAWDVSESGDRRVLAWVRPNGELYDLYIGAEGGISAGKFCDWLFAYYSNVTQIHNMSFLHTENVWDMSYMFWRCESLTSLDLSNFDTSQVQYMTRMFEGCNSLVSLDLSSFDTFNVQNMSFMFYTCRELTTLDLSSFDTSNVQDMSRMFESCSALTSLDLSSFDISNVQDTAGMFYNCPAGADWRHLLN